MRTPITFSRRSVLAMPLALAACKYGSQVIEIVGSTMGTSYKVVALDPTRSVGKSALEGAISTALVDVNRAMSNWDPSSEISIFNENRGTMPQAVSADLTNVMTAAFEVNQASQGRFDTTMGPLIELWGFGAPGEPALPSPSAIESARAQSGHENTLQIGAGYLQKARPQARVYLAAIGKGFGADKIGQTLAGFGITDYLVEIGGDLYAAGRNPEGLPWQIGIETPNPTSRSVHHVVGLSNLGLATSGDYRNYFEHNGRRYSHLIDPTTGRPVEHKTASATVLAQDAMRADAWATAMLVLGRERGLDIANAQGIAVQFIDRAAVAGGHAEPFATFNSDAFAALTS